MGEQDFLNHLATNNFPSIWLTIIGTSQSEASTWASQNSLDPETVLYDNAGWAAQGVFGGIPTIHCIHTSNMLIWERVVGWYDTTSGDWPDVMNYYANGSDGLLDYILGQADSTD